MINTNYDFDNNNQDDLMINGNDNDFLISDFVTEFDTMNEFDVMDFDNNEVFTNEYK